MTRLTCEVVPLPTRGSVYEQSLEAAIGKARALAHRHHEREEIAALLVAEGARLENYVKATWFPGQSARGTLNDFIDKLPVGGARTMLHEVRTRYNESKHDTNHAPRLLDLVALLERMLQAVRTVNATGLGLTNDIASRGTQRVFWLAAWDHFVGGDTEIHFMFPGDTDAPWGPPEFDLIYIDARSWGDFVRKLALFGSVREGKGLIPERWLKAWEVDDFLGALVFEGEYRALLSAAAEFALHQDLIVGLNRGDRADQTWVASLLACVDVAAMPGGNYEELIRARAMRVYALPAGSVAMPWISQTLGKLLEAVPVANRAYLSGPVWLGATAFEELKAGAIAFQPTPPVLVDRQLRLVTVQLH